LDSRPADKSRSPADSFACALDKPLTAEVFARSVLIAVGNDPGTNGFTGFDLMQVQKLFAQAFPEVFPTENVSSLRQALFLSNNRTVETLTQSIGTNQLSRLAALDDKAKVKELFVRVLAREPDAAEMARALAHLRAHSEAPESATRQLLWALLAGAEFRINH
ncbi:MAG TPA: hypothetical protein VGF13_07200, partial [Verrucomicrobiae bacterium]